MTVTRRTEGQLTTYEIKSEVTFRILFSFTVDFTSFAKYDGSDLVKEYTLNELNGRTQSEGEVIKLEKGYQYITNGIASNISEPIEYSIAAIYFKEPFDGQHVFSPAFGQFLVFKETSDGIYEMESPDGLNVYYYSNGLCTKVDVFRDFAKFSFEMTDKSLSMVHKKSIKGSTHGAE